MAWTSSWPACILEVLMDEVNTKKWVSNILFDLFGSKQKNQSLTAATLPGWRFLSLQSEHYIKDCRRTCQSLYDTRWIYPQPLRGTGHRCSSCLALAHIGCAEESLSVKIRPRRAWLYAALDSSSSSSFFDPESRPSLPYLASPTSCSCHSYRTYQWRQDTLLRVGTTELEMNCCNLRYYHGLDLMIVDVVRAEKGRTTCEEERRHRARRASLLTDPKKWLCSVAFNGNLTH